MKFAVKKSDKDKPHSPWEINREGSYGALVLRYWGCNLSCFLCYSQSYAYLDEEGSRVKKEYFIEDCRRNINNLTSQVGWTRIQGGEPLLDYERAKATAELCKVALDYMKNHSPYENPRVIIQTNGIWIGRGKEEEVSSFLSDIVSHAGNIKKGRIIIELSFKGTRDDIADTYGDSLNRLSKITTIQLEAFARMSSMFKNIVWNKTGNIVFYPVAGIGVQLRNPGFIPVTKNDTGKELPYFHPDTWGEGFRGMIDEFKKILQEKRNLYADFIEKNDSKIPIECIEPSFFQKGWISQIKKRPTLENYIIKNLRITQSPQLNLFKKDIGIGNIPEANSALLEKLKDLEECFYEAEPSQHYPYL